MKLLLRLSLATLAGSAQANPNAQQQPPQVPQAKLDECQQPLEKEKNDCQGQLTQKDQQITQVNQGVAERDHNISLLQGKLDEAANKYKLLQQDSLQQKQQLEQELQSEQNNAKSISQAAETNKQELVEFQTKQQSLETQLQTLTDQLEKSKGELEKMNQEVAQNEAGAKEASVESSKLKGEVDDLSKKLEKLEGEKKSSEDNLKATSEKAEKEMEKVKSEFEKSKEELSKSKKNAGTIKTEKTELEKKVKALQGQIETMKGEMEKVKADTGFIGGVGEKGKRVGALLYSTYLQPHLGDHLTNLSNFDTASLSDLQTTLSKSTSTLYTQSLESYNEVSQLLREEIYEKQVSPLLSTVKVQVNEVYDEHLKEHVQPLLKEGGKQWKALKVQKQIDMVSEQANEIFSSVKELKNEGMKMLPKELNLEKLDLSSMSPSTAVDDVSVMLGEIKERVFQSVTVTVLGEEFVFEQGVPELVGCGVVGGLGVYVASLLSLFLLKFLIGFLLYKLTYRFLIRSVLISGILNTSFKLFSFFLSLFIFTIKLLMCCGCCGMCFRRSRAAAGGNGNSQQNLKGKTANPGKQQLTTPPKAAAKQVLKKKGK